MWFELSLVVGTIAVEAQTADNRLPLAVYVGTLCCLFATSALYHRGTWRPAVRRLLQRLDHAMIFMLIAGTMTPIITATMQTNASRMLLVVLWSLTSIALITHMVWMHAPERLVGLTYVLLGCLGIGVLPAVWGAAGVAAFLLITVGGALYILGAVLYHRRRPDPWPSVFGYHEVFHAFVCGGATLHFLAITQLIL